jgi:hypothetical protein
MALDSYTNLKTEISSWMSRSDLTAQIDTFIDLFEAWANRNLRVRQMENEATATAAEYISLPTDYVGLRDVQVQSTPRRQLQYVTPEYADMVTADGATGDPSYYTIVGNQLRLVPSPASADDVRISYWQEVPALNDTQTTNWLLGEYPDSYLYGSLMHARAFMPDEARSEFIKSSWQAVVTEIQRAGNRSNLGGSLTQRAG